MKIVFTLGSATVGGGTNVIFEHATRLVDEGEDVYIITNEPVQPEDYSWHSSAHKLKWITYEDLDDYNFDIAIGTWWRTIYEMYRIKAKKYFYFVQSIESRFYDDEENRGVKFLAELTYSLGLNVITEATWIKEYLKHNYGIDALLVKNGIKKDVFTLDGDIYDKCDGLRVLVEGPINVPFKNVPKTIELVKKSKAKEVWLLTSSQIESYEGVDRLFSNIPVKDCAKIYRSCDVIVKLSYVEGMFGPPLEMFHCGGTCIVYDVTGHDEYIVDKYNGFVVNSGNEDEVVEKINELCDNPKLLNKLKKNAIKTAEKWPSWKESSKDFYEAIKELNKKDSISRETLEYKSKFFFDIYVKYEEKDTSKTIKQQLGEKFRAKLPRIYRVYHWLVHLFRK
jgi:glycosyltransferase involved in cell wall biosynthesis